MAARQEIIDFINAERNTNVLLTNEEVNTLIFRILKIYSERKADIETLKNDLLDMVIRCRMSERLGAKEYVIFDFTKAIELLLQTSKDWQVFLPESEINRYEGKRLGNIENLASYIRRLYRDKQDDKSIYDYMRGDDKETRLTEAHKVEGRGYDPVRAILRILFPEVVPKLPPLKVFYGEFGDKIKKSGYSDICNEIRDLWKEKKKPDKLD